MTLPTNKVTFAHILTILAIIFIPLLVWGVSIEKRFEQVIYNKKDILKIKEVDDNLEKEVDGNHKEIMKTLLEIQVEQAKAHK